MSRYKEVSSQQLTSDFSVLDHHALKQKQCCSSFNRFRSGQLTNTLRFKTYGKRQNMKQAHDGERIHKEDFQ
jgi:hypothetical protein